MMTGALCAIALFWFQESGAGNDPAKLVAQLGALKYADRQAAAEALERMGRPALSALRKVQDSPDLEVKTRANGLIRKIESGLLTQPTLLNLNFKNAPLLDVVKSISEQSGMKINIYPDSLPRWKAERITLEAPEPVPFWTGIDRLCAVSKLRHNPAMINVTTSREPSFTLVAGETQQAFPTSDQGPFRVSLIRLHYERDVTFGAIPPALPRPAEARPSALDPSRPGTGGTSVVNVQFNAQIQVVAEPRLALSQNGAVQVEEAVDDLGNSLTNPAGTPGLTMSNGFRRPVMPSAGQLTQLVFPLKRPQNPGSTIKVLKGVVPIQVASRRGDPLVVPITSAAGKSFENGESSVTVHSFTKNPNNRMSTLELTIRSTGAGERIDGAGEPLSIGHRSDISQMQIEILDTQGKVLPWFQSSVDPDSTRISMTLNQFGQMTEPKELRLYALTRAEVKVAFEFRDITMP